MTGEPSMTGQFLTLVLAFNVALIGTAVGSGVTEYLGLTGSLAQWAIAVAAALSAVAVLRWRIYGRRDGGDHSA